MVRQRILDKLALLPSRDKRDPGKQQRTEIRTSIGRLEIYSQRVQNDQPSLNEPDLLVVKWPGNAGRAESSTAHPADAWPEKVVEIWTINPHGYGRSEGRASLRNVAPMAEAVWQHARQQFPATDKLIFGTSIGCVTTLFQATIDTPASTLKGLLLRNPPPLPELLRGHYHRWHYGPFTKWVTAILHGPLDSVEQAGRCHVPLFLLQSEADTTVPAKYQDFIYDAYAGPKQRFIVPGAEHNDLPENELREDYLCALRSAFDVT